MDGRLIARNLVLVLCFVPVAAQAGEEHARWYSENIATRHMPFGTVLDPVLDGRGEVAGYSRCGDSALWTGHLLAGESFRFNITRTPEALEAVHRALTGIHALVDVTGTDGLARCLVPMDSPYAPGILSEENDHGSYTGTWAGKPYHWVGDTSRDQYSGVFFGLGVAYEVVEDSAVRAEVRELVTRLLDKLLRDNWAVVMPDGSWSTVFWGRADQQLAFLAVGRTVNPDRYSSSYNLYRFWYASSVATPLAAEALDQHNSYFKFNLAAINLYHLVRTEGNEYYGWWYRRAYDVFHTAVENHGNAFFDLIDRGIRGPDAARDARTRLLLDVFLQREMQDGWLDWRGVYPSCGQPDRACEPLPVERRIRSDFLWQRSPFLLYGGGTGAIQGAGIDYILPYWMARYFGVL